MHRKDVLKPNVTITIGSRAVALSTASYKDNWVTTNDYESTETSTYMEVKRDSKVREDTLDVVNEND